MKIHRPSLHPSGLTLLELLVVLTILVALSTVAITSTSGVADQARYEATQRTLENIRDAVIGPANLRDTDGTLLYTGFVADTGRLPKAVAEVVDGGTVLTLAELVQQPAGMAAYQVLPATTSNCTPEGEADAADLNVSADTIRLGVGWRGPYLRLPLGNFLPRDGWGAQLVTPVGAGDPIDQIISYGKDGAIGGVEYDYDQNIAFEATSYDSELTVQVEFRDSSFGLVLPDNEAELKVRLFSPASDDPTRPIQVNYYSISFNDASIDTSLHRRSVVQFHSNQFTPSMPLTIGAKAVRAYYSVGNNKSSPAYLMLRPGQNYRTLVITVP